MRLNKTMWFVQDLPAGPQKRHDCNLRFVDCATLLYHSSQPLTFFGVSDIEQASAPACLESLFDPDLSSCQGLLGGCLVSAWKLTHLTLFGKLGHDSSLVKPQLPLPLEESTSSLHQRVVRIKHECTEYLSHCLYTVGTLMQMPSPSHHALTRIEKTPVHYS